MREKPTIQTSRIGEQHRVNVNRYFHVMSQGWYAYTREGIRGPFVDKLRAEVFINDLGGKQDHDPSTSWRL
ncbi:MAG: hypothetical protein HY080_00105 [Gammaproteobacteria bacterium]|nr:hypothetical protein [Gammaproteobacteria bacterium]